MINSNNRLMNQVRLANTTAALTKLVGNVFSRTYLKIFYNQCVPNDIEGCLV